MGIFPGDCGLLLRNEQIDFGRSLHCTVTPPLGLLAAAAALEGGQRWRLMNP